MDLNNIWEVLRTEYVTPKHFKVNCSFKKEKSGACIQWNITQPQKEANNAIFSNTDGPGDYHTKWRKLEKKMNMWFHVESKKENTNELIYELETDLQT